MTPAIRQPGQPRPLGQRGRPRQPGQLRLPTMTAIGQPGQPLRSGRCGPRGEAGRTGQRGIALLEAMLAIVILGIGLLGTVGMQARAYSALADAGMRAEATLASEKLIGVMSADVASINLYNLAENGAPNTRLAAWAQETKTAIPGAVLAVTVADQPAMNRYQIDISIRWQRKARSEVNQHRVTSYIAR
ncbi:type IV pilus modification PilV family protein [Duganella sp. P38]|uniref:type IV pilus modification PilV family protein n=1 Tax=Duganella sp. P38 TaxID=3423949 RepID=UPI003D7A7A38